MWRCVLQSLLQCVLQLHDYDITGASSNKCVMRDGDCHGALLSRSILNVPERGVLQIVVPSVEVCGGECCSVLQHVSQSKSGCFGGKCLVEYSVVVRFSVLQFPSVLRIAVCIAVCAGCVALCVAVRVAVCAAVCVAACVAVCVAVCVAGCSCVCVIACTRACGTKTLHLDMFYRNGSYHTDVTHRNTLRHIATHCNTLQHIATRKSCSIGMSHITLT